MTQTCPANSPVEPLPRRFQFGLRALLLAFVPVAIIALPIGFYVRRPVPPQPVPVTGTVTLDGTPVGFATVGFYPIAQNGHVATGITDSTGTFKLRMFIDGSPPVSGAFPGGYMITVLKEGSNGAQFGTPAHFAIPFASPLTAEVTSDGPNNFTFNLVTE